MVDQTSKDLLVRYRAGDSRAANEIFDRYLRRLIELARKRISSKVARRIDPEDIVQSAYRSFFVHARDGDFVLQRANDLWRLLAGITLNKLHGQVERHTAQRREIPVPYRVLRCSIFAVPFSATDRFHRRSLQLYCLAAASRVLAALLG